jgi:tight adherence protein B
VSFTKRKEAPRNASAEAVRALAALVRSGLPLRQAVTIWHRDAPAPLVPALRVAARRVSLGEAPERTLGRLDAVLGPDAHSLAVTFSLHGGTGADLTAMLDRLAATIDQRCDAIAAGRAAAAGALLSARVVAGLPLLLMAASPMAGAPLFDVVGVIMLIAGGGFAVGGLVWMSRLVPRPPEGDDVATMASGLAAAALLGGAPIHRVMNATAKVVTGPGAEELARVRRQVALGATWHEALGRSPDEGLAAMGAVIQRAVELGVPTAGALNSFAHSRRATALREFEAATRRAPVVMAAPLSLCILPAYALLGLGPYVRSLSFGG